MLHYRYHSYAGSSRATRDFRSWNHQHWPSGCSPKANCLPMNDAGVVFTTVAVVDLTLLLAALTSPRVRSTTTNVTFTFIFLVVLYSLSVTPTTVARGRHPPPGRKKNTFFWKLFLPTFVFLANRYWQSTARILMRGGVPMLDGLDLVASRALHRATPTAANSRVRRTSITRWCRRVGPSSSCSGSARKHCFRTDPSFLLLFVSPSSTSYSRTPHWTRFRMHPKDACMLAMIIRPVPRAVSFSLVLAGRRDAGYCYRTRI